MKRIALQTLSSRFILLRRLMSQASVQVKYSSGTPGPIEQSIVKKLCENFNPTFLKIANDSHKHSHHAGMEGAENVKESHFRLELISDMFKGQNLPSRHRSVYKILDDELTTKGVHALQMKLKTTEEVNK